MLLKLAMIVSDAVELVKSVLWEFICCCCH